MKQVELLHVDISPNNLPTEWIIMYHPDSGNTRVGERLASALVTE
jgi:hypothetical protein